MSEFIKKGNKYYRNNSDGTQTQVTPTQDGYFTWTQPDGKKVRSQKRYKISTTSQKKERKPSLWDSFKTGLRNFGAYSAISEPSGSAIQTSEGTQINNDGSFTYNKPTEGSEQLRKINGMIGLSGLAGYGGGAALSYTPAIVPEITIGQLPWWQTTIGSTAGSIATGMTADKISKRITGKTIGGNVKSGVASFGPAGQMYTDIIPEGVWDMINPFYGVNPESIVKGFSTRPLSHTRYNIPDINNRSIWRDWGDESFVRIGDNYVDKVSKTGSRTKFGLGFQVREKLSANEVPSHVPYEYRGYTKINDKYHPIYTQKKVEINRAEGPRNIDDISRTLQDNGYKTSTITADDGSSMLQGGNGTFEIFDIYSNHNVGSLNGRGVIYDAKIGQGVKYPLFWLRNNFNLFPNGISTNFQQYPISTIIGSEINSNN